MPVPQPRDVRIVSVYIESDCTNVPLLISGGDLELPEWLFRYVFPTEKKFADTAYADRVYNEVVDRSIASGVRDCVCTMYIVLMASGRRRRAATMQACTLMQPSS